MPLSPSVLKALITTPAISPMAKSTPKLTKTALGWAAHDSSGKLTPFIFKRRENGVDDVTIKILYCGMCRTDVHFAKNDWGNTAYPIVPGYEITGIVIKVGSNVSNLKIGERVGVGYVAASCLECELCKSFQENYCDHMRPVYNSIHWDGSPTYGGYSTMLVADHRYVVHIPESLPMDRAAPLMGAGLTVYTAMKHSNLFESKGKHMAVIGLGGVGHMAIKFGKAFGHHVTVISTSPFKEKDAKEKLGADGFILSTDLKQMLRNRRSLDFVIDTVSAKHSLGPYLELLKVNGIISIVGEPAQPIEVPATPLIYGKKVIRGSIIGSVKEIQEMMYFCGEHNILCDIEVVSTDKINEAFDRLAKNDVKFRFVLNVAGHQSSKL
ncbi:probable cinnamyl alcohol dehydrogenase 6 [Lycium ferocissimum]|uniref:probable cinnamyl alcohol dehydrogenase 6 n=1 Tax=Lycium ferocissimum TaxID=112874 RepID=UPI0028168BFC|nr:probable cinnamyl alcohol dehydrogenase 6 [Lycium ferocissimum]